MAKHNKKKGGLQRKVSSVFKQVSIPQQEDEKQIPTKPVHDAPCGAPSRPTSPDSLVSKSSLMKKVCQSKSSSDEAVKKITKTTHSKQITWDQSASQGALMDELTQPEDPSSKVEPNLTVEDSKILKSQPISKQSSVNKHQQFQKPLDKAGPSIKSWVPSKLTTPDDPISRAASTKKPEQAESAQDKTKPDRMEVRDPQKQSIAGKPAAQDSLMRKLYQAKDEPDVSTLDRAAEAPVISKSTEPQSSQNPKPETRYEPEMPQRNKVPSTQPKAIDFVEASGPNLWQRINNKLFAPKPNANPARQKVMVIFVPILAIIFIFALRQVLSKSPSKTQGASTKDDAPTNQTESGHEIDWQIPELLPAVMRDPTKLPDQNNTQSEDQNPKINTTTNPEITNLGAIVYSQNKTSAVVNGRIVHVGDRVGDVTILRINKDSVEFERDGKRWVQKIRE
jgi:hypothetical protein